MHRVVIVFDKTGGLTARAMELVVIVAIFIAVNEAAGLVVGLAVAVPLAIGVRVFHSYRGR